MRLLCREGLQVDGVNDDRGLFPNPCPCDIEVNVFGCFCVGHSVSEHEGFYHERIRVHGEEWFVHSLCCSEEGVFKSVC